MTFLLLIDNILGGRMVNGNLRRLYFLHQNYVEPRTAWLLVRGSLGELHAFIIAMDDSPQGVLVELSRELVRETRNILGLRDNIPASFRA